MCLFLQEGPPSDASTADARVVSHHLTQSPLSPPPPAGPQITLSLPSGDSDSAADDVIRPADASALLSAAQEDAIAHEGRGDTAAAAFRLYPGGLQSGPAEGARPRGGLLPHTAPASSSMASSTSTATFAAPVRKVLR